MITFICRNTIREGLSEKVFKLCEEFAEYTRKQPGNIEYRVLMEDGKPNELVFFESWESDDALNNYLQQEEFDRLFSPITECFAAEEILNRYQRIW